MIAQYIFIVTAALMALTFIIVTLGANIHDLKEIKIKKDIALHPHRKQYRLRPLITVVVSTYNNEKTIEECLQSIIKNKYRNIQIIVIDSMSTDQTKRIVRTFIKLDSRLSIRLIARKSFAGKMQDLKRYEKYYKGEYISIIAPDSQIAPSALANAAMRLNNTDNLKVIKFKIKIRFTYSTAYILEQYVALINYWREKFISTIYADSVTKSFNGLLRRETFENLVSKKANNLYIDSCFGNESVVYGNPISSYRLLLKSSYSNHQRLIKSIFHKSDISSGLTLAIKKYISFEFIVDLLTTIFTLSLPFVLTYLIYLAVIPRETSLLVFSVFALSTVIFLTVWFENSINWLYKIFLTILIPLSYFAFYILSIVGFLGLIAGAFSMLGRNKNTYSTNVV